MRFLIFLWVLPTTLIGVMLGVFLVLFGAKVRLVYGVLEVHGGWLAQQAAQRGGFAAMALGHVILGCSDDVLEQLRRHEHVHVRQAERWGALFAPVYLFSSLWQWLRGRHPYYDNPFEREAFAADVPQIDRAQSSLKE